MLFPIRVTILAKASGKAGYLLRQAAKPVSGVSSAIMRYGGQDSSCATIGPSGECLWGAG